MSQWLGKFKLNLELRYASALLEKLDHQVKDVGSRVSIGFFS